MQKHNWRYAIIDNEIRLIPKKKVIKDDFFFGYSLAEFLLIGIISIIFFLIFDSYDRIIAYKVTFTVMMVLGLLLIEVPTTQLRFGTILMKCIRYLIKKRELYFNPKKVTQSLNINAMELDTNG